MVARLDISQWGYIFPKWNRLEFGNSYAKQTAMMLNFFHEGAAHSQKQKELYSEMCDKWNDVLDYISALEIEWKEHLQIRYNNRGVDVIEKDWFTKYIAKNSKTWTIWVLVMSNGTILPEWLELDIDEYSIFGCVKAFIFKDENDVVVDTYYENKQRAILSWESKEIIDTDKSEEKIEEEQIESEITFDENNISESDMLQINQEISKIDPKVIIDIAMECWDNHEKLADTLFNKWYISERTKLIMKMVWVVIDIGI